MVDVARHLAGAPGPPGPDRRRHVVDDRQIRPAPRDPLRHLVREIRAVDDDEHVGLGGEDCGDRLVARGGRCAADAARIEPRPITAMSPIGKMLCMPRARIRSPARPVKRRIRPAAFDRVDQPRAQLVAGFLADHDGDAERPLSHRRGRRRRCRPKRKSPALRKASSVCSRPARSASARLGGDAVEAGAARRLGGSRPDGGDVEPPVLLRLQAFHQDAAGLRDAAGFAQRGHALQQGIRAAGILHRDDAARHRDGAPGRCRGGRSRAPRRRPSRCRRRGLVHDAFGLPTACQSKVGRHVERADQLDALLGKDRGDAGEQAVVAAAHQLQDARDELDGAEIRHDRGEVRAPVDRADEDRLPAALRFDQLQEAAELAPADDVVGAVAERCLRPPRRRWRRRPACAPCRPTAAAIERAAGLRRPRGWRPDRSDGSSVMRSVRRRRPAPAGCRSPDRRLRG